MTLDLRRMVFVVLAVLVYMACAPARAAAPEVRVNVLGPQPVLVGQQVEIQVTVAAPNFFTSAPPFPQLSVDGAIVTMPDDRSTHGVDQAGGQTVATIRKSYVFVARRAGEFVLPQVPIDFTYSGEGGASQHAHLQLPATRITARLPEGAREGDAVLPVAALQVTQRFDRDTSGLAAGDALVRTVQVEARNTQAMLIPPPQFDAPAGVRVFAADPALSDHTGRDGGFTGGRRIDKVTYVFEREGTYTLPAVELRWFDPGSHKPASAQAPAVTVHVKAAASAGEGIAPDLPATAAQVRRRIPWATVAAWAAGLALLAALSGWAWRRRRRWQAARAARQQARLRSDAHMFDLVLQACHRNDAAAAHAALLAWSRAHARATPREWALQVGDEALGVQIDALERHLFSRGVGAQWSAGALSSALGAAHRRWRQQRAVRTATGWRRLNAHELQQLNPMASSQQ